MTRLVITRHGHVEGIDPPRFRGRTELELSERGRRDIAALARAATGEVKPAAIYASPLGRCVATAGAVGAAVGVVPQVDPNLLDLDYGDWQGRTHAEIGEVHPEMLACWYKTPQLVRFPNGEALQDVAVRTADMLRQVVARHADDTVMLVGHASVNRVLLLHLLDMPLSSYWRLDQSPCALSVVELAPGRIHASRVNDTAHLARTA